jgi:SWI/SNF-related matrix-associated actin-dependent regulator of chromatin subfamily A member 5
MARRKSSTERARKRPSPHEPEPDINRERRVNIGDDIEAIIMRGEERTASLNAKYEGLNLEDLSNFKSDSSVQQWDGEDFRGVRSSTLLYVYTH